MSLITLLFIFLSLFGEIGDSQQVLVVELKRESGVNPEQTGCCEPYKAFVHSISTILRYGKDDKG